MSIVLSVYSKNAFKEFVLPAVNNTEVTLLLEHYIFQIRSDIQLKLEVLDGEWYFQDMEERIYANHSLDSSFTNYYILAYLLEKCYPSLLGDSSCRVI